LGLPNTTTSRCPGRSATRSGHRPRDRHGGLHRRPAGNRARGHLGGRRRPRGQGRGQVGENRLDLDINASGGPTDPLEVRRQRVDAERLVALGATIASVLQQEGLDHHAVAITDPRATSSTSTERQGLTTTSARAWRASRRRCRWSSRRCRHGS
jgi:hypothetical protein